MFKFFQKIRKKLLKEGNLKRYLIYAFGEILLIVIGILIALQISNWNKSTENRNYERLLLSHMIDALEMDIKDLKHNIHSIEKSINSITIVLTNLEEKQPYNDSLNQHFGNCSLVLAHIPNLSTYENLKSTGLQLISNDSLRQKILNYYDYHSQYLLTAEDDVIIPYHNLSVQPKMLKEFNYSWVIKPAMPNQYEQLFQNSEFFSLLRTAKELKEWQLGLTKTLLEKAEELKTEIEEVN